MEKVWMEEEAVSFPARIYEHRALSYRSDAPEVGATAPRNTQNGRAAARNTRSGGPA